MQAPAAYPTSHIAGYDPGPVNQFGTPLAASAAPTGPYAAPGIGAVPAATAGIVSAWPGPGGAFAPPGPTQRRSLGAQQRPGTVLAAGILAILGGSLDLVAALLTLLAISVARSAIADAGGHVSASQLSIANAVVFVLALIGVAWVALGIGACRGHRTSVRIMRILVVLGTLLAIWQVVSSTGVSSLTTLALDLGMLALLWNRGVADWLAAA
jgi:hypothetical protein